MSFKRDVQQLEWGQDGGTLFRRLGNALRRSFQFVFPGRHQELSFLIPIFLWVFAQGCKQTNRAQACSREAVTGHVPDLLARLWGCVVARTLKGLVSK